MCNFGRALKAHTMHRTAVMVAKAISNIQAGPNSGRATAVGCCLPFACLCVSVAQLCVYRPPACHLRQPVAQQHVLQVSLVLLDCVPSQIGPVLE
jgi:hypothetical protein